MICYICIIGYSDTPLLHTIARRSDHPSAPALVVFPELPDFLEVLLEELCGLLAVAVVQLARLPSELFGQHLCGHLAVEVLERGLESDVVLVRQIGELAKIGGGESGIWNSPRQRGRLHKSTNVKTSTLPWRIPDSGFAAPDFR